MKKSKKVEASPEAVTQAHRALANVRFLTIPVLFLAGTIQVMASTSRPILLSALTLFQLLAFHSNTFKVIQYKYIICKALKPYLGLIHVLIYLLRTTLLERNEIINIGFAVTVMIGICFQFDVVGAVTAQTVKFPNMGTIPDKEEDEVDQELLNKTIPISLLYIGTTAILVQKQLYAEALGFIVALVSVMALSRLLLTILQADYETTTRILNELHEANTAKDKFVGNISHEFRSPLMSITASVSLLRMTGDISPEQDKHLATIDACGNVMLTLIDEVLRFAQIEEVMKASPKQPFDLKQCLSKIENIIRPLAAQQKVELKTEVDQSLPSQIIGDSTQLKHVAFALLTNAIKASPPQETVTLKVEKVNETRKHVTVKVEVCDKGSGIPEEKHAEVFKPFAFIIDNSAQFRRFPGAGLGLASSKKVIESMGGSISFRSSPQQGSIFTVTVPLEKISECSSNNVKNVFRDVARIEFHTRYMEHYNSFAKASTETTSELDMMNIPKQVEQVEPCSPKCSTCMAPTFIKSTPAEATTTSLTTTTSNNCNPTTTATSADSKSAIRAVIAEDNIINRTVLTRLLQRCGYKVTAVSDGVELLEVCAKQQFDLVLTDYHMPNCCGVSATKRLRKNKFPAKIVLLTADALANVVEFQDLFDAILLKPISFPKLQLVLNEVLKSSNEMCGMKQAEEQVQKMEDSSKKSNNMNLKKQKL